jgi:von Willebrand factor type A domain-containing protein
MLDMTLTRSLQFAAGVAAITALSVATTSLDAQRATREQHVYVAAVTGEDAPLTDLKPAEFKVREDGVAREILKATTPAPPPTHLALLVDDSDVAQSAVADLRIALTSFVKKMMAGANGLQMSYTTFGERPTKQVDFTANPATLEKAVARLFHRTGAGAYFMEAVQEACKDLRKREAARPVIVAFVVDRGPEFSSAIHQQVEDALKAVGASLWTVVLQEGPQTLGSTEMRERAIVIGDVTRDSGGDNKTVLSRQALENGFLSRAAILNSRYDVSYGRPESLVPPTKMEVDVTRKDVRVLAPRWIKK